MMLLEREQALGGLRAALRRTEGGDGAVVLLSGEAGIGKTSLLDAFAADLPDGVRVLVGRCDDLTVPRPLGPFLDIADQAPLLAERLRDAGPGAPAAVLDELRRDGPVVCIVEDAHWADDATIDAIVHVARRLPGVPVLMVVSYRGDAIAADHPLRRALGAVPAAAATRIELAPLSPRAAAALAGDGFDAAALHAATGGNPFFLAELIAAGGDRMPASVRDGVLARLATLTGRDRSVVELVSVVPGRAELWLLEEVLGPVGDALTAGEAAGLLAVGDTVHFRHELARRVVEESLPAPARTDGNRAVLAALAARGAAPARLAHHASRAGDAAALLRHGLAAADDAIARSSHREASDLLSQALGHAGGLGPSDRAAAFERLAGEAYQAGQPARAVDACERAVALRRELGDPHLMSASLRLQARIRWYARDRPGAEAAAVEAVALVEGLPPSRELGMAISTRSQLAMLKSQFPEALAWGRRAEMIARDLGDDEILSHAWINVGTAMAAAGDTDAGQAVLEDAVAVAESRGLHREVGRGLNNIAATAIIARRYGRARAAADRAEEYVRIHGLDTSTRYIQSMDTALIDVATGRWDHAAAVARNVLAQVGAERSVVQVNALAVLGVLAVRRGEPDGRAMLEEAWSLAVETEEFQWIHPVACARAELAWIEGDVPAVDEATREVVAQAAAAGDTTGWYAGELAIWRFRAGLPGGAPDPCAAPFAREIAGDGRGAADLWAEIGDPYARALALLGSGEPTALVEAVGVLDDLGAVPVAAVARGRLRRLGVDRVPRGPRPTTRGNPAGLTHRQLEVLELLVEGMSNPDIARRLVLSPKTVEHHVASVLAKLGVRNRGQAAVVARDLGVFPGAQHGGASPPTRG